jgi:Ca2+-binding EF-hand superfamily protein
MRRPRGAQYCALQTVQLGVCDSRLCQTASMRRRPIIILTFALALSVVLPASAQTSAEERAKVWFKEHDRNHDGYLTADEVVSYERKLFKRKDASGAGKLSLGEYCAGIPANMPEEADRCRRRFAAINSSGDGFITPEEMAAYFKRVLQAADTNGDGKVSLDEWLASPDSH